jgi:hypothetical protein
MSFFDVIYASIGTGIGVSIGSTLTKYFIEPSIQRHQKTMSRHGKKVYRIGKELIGGK